MEDPPFGLLRTLTGLGTFTVFVAAIAMRDAISPSNMILAWNNILQEWVVKNIAVKHTQLNKNL